MYEFQSLSGNGETCFRGFFSHDSLLLCQGTTLKL